MSFFRIPNLLQFVVIYIYISYCINGLFNCSKLIINEKQFKEQSCCCVTLKPVVANHQFSIDCLTALRHRLQAILISSIEFNLFLNNVKKLFSVSQSLDSWRVKGILADFPSIKDHRTGRYIQLDDQAKGNTWRAALLNIFETSLSSTLNYYEKLPIEASEISLYSQTLKRFMINY